MISVATFTSVINQLLPEPHAGLLNGILFGTKATLSKELMDALVKTGTLHIVALSGMNITILESLIGSTLLPFIGKRHAAVATILLIIGFIWFVGPSASVIRAGIMGTLALLATIFGKQKWGLFFFGCTAAVMLLAHPAWIGNLSFQLSAGATLGLILFGKKIIDKKESVFLRSKIYDLRSLIEDALRITLAAQVFTIPLIFFTFRRISLISPLTNVLIGWLIQPLTALGLVTAILGWVSLPLGQVAAWAAWVFLQYLITVIEWTAKIPFSSLGF
jgi:competence protein ComEC